MNKKIKRIISMTLIISSFFAVGPAQYLNFNGITVAHASSDNDDEDEGYLDDLDLSEGSLSFSEKDTSYTVKLDSSDEKVTITATAKKATDKIKIDGSSVDLDSYKKAEKTVELSRGRNLIKIKVETLDYGTRTYNLIINRGSAASGESYTSIDEEAAYLDSIDLSDGNISFLKNKLSYDVNVASNVDEIRIAAWPKESATEVKIDGIIVDNDDSYRRTVKLANGKNVILIELEDENDNEQTYTLNIYRGGATVNPDVLDTEQDAIYLEDLIIQDGDFPIKFKPKVTSYAIDVKDDWDGIIIKAEPEYDNIVRINGSKAEGSYRKRVDLKEGKNVIEVKVDNSNTYDRSDAEYEKRIYTLTVYRGTSQGTAAGTASAGNNNANINANLKTNQWINNNGRWQYNDAIGNPLKNMWFFDKNYGAWYSLDEIGYMRIGWIQAGDGKWYYLYPSGAMAFNTTIDGYKLNSSGAWVK